jgi:5'-nucleotidase
MIILLDQDDVLADFEGHFREKWKEFYPQEMVVPKESRTGFDLEYDYPEHLHQKIREVWRQKGFFADLKPVPGGIEAAHKILELGHDVRICTVPLAFFDYCLREKYEWVKKHMGFHFTRRMILTKDKTLIRGNFLIDDKPEINGITIPEWEHIIFDRPYNRNQTGKRRLDWTNWRKVLGI